MRTKQSPRCDWEFMGERINGRAGDREVTVCCDGCVDKMQEEPTQCAVPAQ